MNTFLQAIFLLCFLGFHATVAMEIIYARVGDDVSLNMPHESTKYFSWFFGNKQVGWTNPSGGKKIETEWQNHVTLSPKTLVIKNITKKDFGIFSCSVKEKIQEIDKKVFKVIQLDVIVDSPILLPGENLSLSCNIRNQEYSPQISWENPQGHSEGENKGKLIVTASSSHSGKWTCVVKNNMEVKNRANIKVTVIDLLPPAPISTWYTSTSSPLTIPCSISASTTWDDVKAKGIQEVGWYFCPPSTATSLKCNKSSLCLLSLENKLTWKPLKDKTLRPSNPSNGNLSLGRNQWREQDSGDYVCFMKFQNGVNLNRTVHVELLKIIASPGTELTSGQQLNLTCTTGHPLPSDLQVRWSLPNKTSLSYSSIHDPQSLHFTIPEVGKDEKGTWRCELWRGEMFLTSAVVTLNIEPKISVWMLVTLCAAAVIFVLLLVLIVILHRRKQRRTRRHKRLCHCKNPKPKGFYRS